jgi:superfamily II DNA or RNA helicase
MAHLVYEPEPTPQFFLWGEDRFPHPAVEQLASLGERSSARMVTDRSAVERVRGTAIPLVAGAAALAGVDAADLDRLPPSVAAWSLAAKLGLDLIARERIVPLLQQRRGPEMEARWGVSLTLREDHERFSSLARALPPAAHAVPRAPETSQRPARARRHVEVWPPHALLAHFADALADTLVRNAATAAPPHEGRRTREAAERESWEEQFAGALRGPDPTLRLDAFLARTLPAVLRAWALPGRGMEAAHAPRLCLKLDPPDGTADAWTLAYFLQAPEDPSLIVPARRIWAARGERFRWMNRAFETPQEHLLRGLALAARLFPPIEESLTAMSPESASLTSDDAWRFISEAAPLLMESGTTVLLPAEMTAAGRRKLRLRMRVGRTRAAPGVVTGGFAMDSLMDFQWEVALGDRALSREEFHQLVALKRPLIRWRGQWLVLNPREIAEVTRRFEQTRTGTLTAPQALAAALAGELPATDGETSAEVIAEGPLAALITRLRAGGEPAPPPADLAGTLRPYQARGLHWLSSLAGLGLGGCLADDMGLGKTIQLIAFLLARRSIHPADPRPSLIVCPTSVLGNWERELSRFAPTLPVVPHHGADRRAEAISGLPPHAVVLTTYSLLRRDAPLLGEMEWAVAALDEAQNVKNAVSQQARAARSLRATHRFALTGTPVENRLAELWSIMEFSLPGLLGPLERFRRRYAIPIERYRDDRVAGELRRLVGPFILRRIKSDPTIVPDLPSTQEMAVVCTLSREQATLYQAAVDEAMAEIESADGIQRRGRVLALLVALKQICNHPAHYLGEAGPLPGRSGKLDRLTEMLEETLAAGDRALIFTQFREMGDRLTAHLQQTLGTEALFLHGGVPRTARDAMVRRFREETAGPMLFVLSLKAGGTGLNLERASRVFHFDRWWNPAVEDQATGRAHRIGQRRVVQVYRLLTAGTVEERIDALLAGKRALADRVVGAGEAWITELSDAELRRLLSLSTDAVVGDDFEESTGARRAGARRASGSGRPPQTHGRGR